MQRNLSKDVLQVLRDWNGGRQHYLEEKLLSISDIIHMIQTPANYRDSFCSTLKESYHSIF